MLTSQRKREILETLTRDGQVIAKTLSERYGVSEDTIRRDLREMAAEGLLQRVHGGALPASPAVGGLSVREQLSSPAKGRIAHAAAQLVAPGQTIIIDGGTTSIELVTHSPNVAVALAEHHDIDVILIGGRLFRHSMVTVGTAALEALGHIRADIFFMGVTGVHLRAGLSTGDLEEAYMKRALSAQAAETVVLASAEKINTASRCKIGEIGLANTIVAERGAPADFVAGLERLGITVVLA
jgi:DeoR/GlpR family transcriptional regulator of sugar metabolism